MSLGMVVLGVGAAVATVATVALVLSSRSSSAPSESADSVLEGTPPRRTDEQNGAGVVGAIRDGIGLARDGLAFARERTNAAEREADRQDAIAGERAGGIEK
jgi:hypothetical protein